MKRVNLATNASTLHELLDIAREETVILTTSEGREFVLAEVEDFDREVESVRQHRELLAFLDERSREAKTYSAAEVRNLLGIS